MVRRFDHLEAPKRFSGLSSPVFSRVETIVFTMKVGWSSARNCTRHSTELPLPFGLTSKRSGVIHDPNSADIRVAIEPLRIVDGFKAFDDLLAVDRFDRA